MPARSSARVVPWIVLLGVIARAVHLFADRSLWLDEAMLALNLAERSFAGLAGSLDFNQAAPLGFLWAEKLAVVLLGLDEIALRLWPYLAGVAALIVFAVLARRLLSPGAALFAMAAFALSTSLVYYSAELKPYAFDVLFAALLPALAVGRGRPNAGALAAAGAIGVWFSYALVFVLPGVGLYACIRTRPDPDTVGPGHGFASGSAGEPGPVRETRRRLLAVFLVWGASFLAAWLATGRETAANPLMARFWAEGFMPLPTSGAALQWYAAAFAGWVRNTLDFSDAASWSHGVGIAVGGALALAGAWYAWSRDRARLALVASPTALALLASALSLYPFRGRLILFLVPTTLILIAWGVDWALSSSPRSARALGAAAAALFLLSSATVLLGWLRSPYREELRPVLGHVATATGPGDVVYLHSGARHAALFYARACPSCRIEGATVIHGRFLSGRPEAIAEELERLPGTGRLWLVFSHEWWGYGDAERDALVEELERRAGPGDRFEAPGAEAYRFDFGSP